ncbi:MAG: hypothetical protein KH745_07500 [Bilophila sp.]|nr:hypothetical protein [Bilophila sp.]
MPFSLKFQGKPTECLSHEIRQGENWRKRLYVHRAVEMKQPDIMTEPWKKGIGN